MPTNSATPGKSVPGAWAELRRMSADDTRGVVFYSISIAAMCLLVVAVVMVA